jgi:Asp-tRNA(Asn)/Glu-tRNA(Gln) amidotransferase A subunit family amidase
VSDPVTHSAVELGDLYRRGSLSPVEVTRAHLDRIDRLDRAVGSYITLTPEMAMEQAAEAEARFRSIEPL